MMTIFFYGRLPFRYYFPTTRRPSTPRDQSSAPALQQHPAWGYYATVSRTLHAFPGPLVYPSASPPVIVKKDRIVVLFSISLGNPNMETIANSASRIIGFLNSASGETIPIHQHLLALFTDG